MENRRNVIVVLLVVAGLLFTGALKLFLIPVLYYDFYKDEEKKNSTI